MNQIELEQKQSSVGIDSRIGVYFTVIFVKFLKALIF